MNKLFAPFLPPWAETGLQPAFYDVESGTVLQQTARMYNKVNQLTRLFNEFSEATSEEVNAFEREVNETVEDYIEKFTALKDFVDDYFDNLDVQEEVNNKLDAMVEDGTLDEIVARYLDKSVYYIFPKNWDGSIQSGDVALIKAFGKNIVIDTGYPEYESQVEEFLDEEDASHIDYLILTHYHGDHVGNVEALFNDGYIDSNTTMYLPPMCNLVAVNPEMTTYFNLIHALCTTNNIPYVTPEEGSALTLDDTYNIYFYNTDVDALNNYDTTDQNQTSIVLDIVHGGKHAVFTGDANNIVISRLMSDGYLLNAVDFYKVEHHGFNWGGVAINDLHTYLNIAKPKLAWIPANSTALRQNNVSASFTCSRLKALGTEMFAQYNNTENVKFVSTPEIFEPLFGKAVASVSNATLTSDIYVDASTSDVMMDGTREHPFKDILQAIGYCVGKRELINIFLADGTYNNSHPDNHDKDVARFKDLNIRFHGNSSDRTKVIIKDGFNAFDSHIYVENCTVSGDTARTLIQVNGCNMHISNCVIKNNIGTLTNDCIAIHSTESLIDIENSLLENHHIALNTHSDNIKENGCTFKDCDTGVYLRNTIFKLGTTAWDNVTTRIYYKRDSYLDMNPVALLSVNASSGTATLQDEITKYNKLIVQAFDSNGILSTNILMTYASNNFALNTTYKCHGFTDVIQITVDSVNPKQITYDAGSSSLRRIYGEVMYKEG